MDFNDPKTMIEKLRDIMMANLIGFATLPHLAIPHMISNKRGEFKSIIECRGRIAAVNSYFISLNEELEYQELKNQIKITLCHLGSIDTITMRNHTDKYFPKWLIDYVTMNAEETAKIILQSGLNGQNELVS
ncbi:20262_t:CDS:2 [Funneliformis geosporum]|uniref:3256_t:CDS:1 n=1 Tax=Funneliformis geosporum TaxID=1117311 RepID=A0A9W4SQ92_9GLOM|nr:20262_t:CDS:2 [Funneliformis geosporum]CAI2176626.1 3256_t:CDS:2 [Funneliformis geosporum]